mgnify:CR=1 FL=1
MAKSNRYQFIILAEGKRDYHFVRRYLLERYGARNTEVRRAPTVAAGDGSGELRVRQRFPKEIRALGSYPGANRYLVVITDGDRYSPEQRRTQLQEQVARKQGDRVAIFVPCRNLESWFAWLDGRFRDEGINHKPDYRDAQPGKQGSAMAERCRKESPTDMPASLQDACKELRWLP